MKCYGLHKMKTAAVLLVLAGAAACGGNAPPSAASPSSGSSSSSSDSSGSTAQQGQDNPTRKLTHDECLSLGESITQSCHGTNTRSAELEGWCGDVIAGIGSGTWVADCEKHIRYMDAVCITSNASIRSMMDCDSAVQR
jgi:hypothetical protein